MSSGKKKLTALSSGMPYCILLNAQKAPTDDLVVRQAIQYAINNKSIISTLFKGLYSPANSVLTPVSAGLLHGSGAVQLNPGQGGASCSTRQAGRWGSGGVRYP